MSVQYVLLPLFVEVLLTFAVMFGMMYCRTSTLHRGETRFEEIALREPNWPVRASQFAYSFSNQFELPVLFYVLTILEIITHHADLPLRRSCLDFCCHALDARAGACDQQQCPRPRCFLRDRRAHPGHHVADLYRAHSSRFAMTPAARLAAAIEVFASIESERRPAADALKSWGLTHRYAGSGDRAAIAGLVYDALRRRASSAFIMQADSPRAILLGMLKRERGLDAEAIGKLADGSKYAPEKLSDDERKRLETDEIEKRPSLRRRRLSAMAGSLFRTHIRRRAGRGGGGACLPRARLICASIL